MPEKIKVANGQEFDLVPMGISNPSDKRRQFKFTSDMPYDDIKIMFLNPDNLASIDHILQSGEVTTTYTDCVSLKQLSTEFDVLIGEETIDVYTALISIDAVEKQVASLQQELSVSQVLSDNAVAELTIMIAWLYGLLS
jgi:hypothetical protein